eukprot:102719-Chlamydomonas_euryale.AAC.1
MCKDQRMGRLGAGCARISAWADRALDVQGSAHGHIGRWTDLFNSARVAPWDKTLQVQAREGLRWCYAGQRLAHIPGHQTSDTPTLYLPPDRPLLPAYLTRLPHPHLHHDNGHQHSNLQQRVAQRAVVAALLQIRRQQQGEGGSM